MTTNQSTVSAEQTRLHLQPVLADLANVADTVDEQHRSLPTPCAEYDVATLTGHIVGWLENFAAGFASDDGSCPSSAVSEVQVPTREAAHRIRAAARTLDDAVRNGATDRPLTIAAQGGMPGEMALSMILGEYLVHGWDLARATGQSWSPAPEAADTARLFFAGMVTPEYRGKDGMFALEVAVPDTDPAINRLVGFTGRDPGWSA